MTDCYPSGSCTWQLQLSLQIQNNMLGGHFGSVYLLVIINHSNENTVCHTYRYCSLTLFWNACLDTYVSLVLVTVLLGKPVIKIMSVCVDMPSSNCDLNSSVLLTDFWGCGRRSGLYRWWRRSCSGSRYSCQLEQNTDFYEEKNKCTRTTDEQHTVLRCHWHLYFTSMQCSSIFRDSSLIALMLPWKQDWNNFFFLQHKY